jgi:hypothetical protein
MSTEFPSADSWNEIKMKRLIPRPGKHVRCLKYLLFLNLTRLTDQPLKAEGEEETVFVQLCS